MSKRARTWLIILVIVVVLAIVAIIAWPWWRHWLPHPAYVRAWINYLVYDLKLGQWAPVAVLLLVGFIELVLAINLGRRSGTLERHRRRLERVHAKEIEVLGQEITLLEEDLGSLQTELELRDGLIGEEKARLWAGFEELQEASGINIGRLVVLDAPEVPSELRSAWRESVSQLERIEVILSATLRKSQTTLQQQQRAAELLRLGIACYHLGSGAGSQ
jgi:hypothetical protein